MSNALKLVTSRFTPYGHRVALTLIEKELDYQKEEINLADKPEWFIKDAPFGKAPLLYVGQQVLFESSAICEYLEDTYPDQNPLHPQNPTDRSIHRAWMAFNDTLLSTIFAVMFSQNHHEFQSNKDDLITKLTQLENFMAGSEQYHPYFGNEKFSLADIFFLASFKPLTFMDEKFTLGILEDFNNIQTYITHLMARTSLKKAMPDNYEELFKFFLEKRNSHLLTMSFSI